MDCLLVTTKKDLRRPAGNVTSCLFRVGHSSCVICGKFAGFSHELGLGRLHLFCVFFSVSEWHKPVSNTKNSISIIMCGTYYL